MKEFSRERYQKKKMAKVREEKKKRCIMRKSKLYCVALMKLDSRKFLGENEEAQKRRKKKKTDARRF